MAIRFPMPPLKGEGDRAAVEGSTDETPQSASLTAPLSGEPGTGDADCHTNAEALVRNDTLKFVSEKLWLPSHHQVDDIAPGGRQELPHHSEMFFQSALQQQNQPVHSRRRNAQQYHRGHDQIHAEHL